MRPLRADPRDPKFSFGYLNNGTASFLDLRLGGPLNILSKQIDEQDGYTLAVRLLFTSRFELFSRSFDLQNVDYVAGPAFSYKFGNQTIDLWIYHWSSHLGDDLISANVRTPFNFSQETARLLYSRYLTPTLRTYAGLKFSLRAEPAELNNTWTFQGGGEFQFLEMFRFATNLQLQQVPDWDLNLTLYLSYDIGSANVENKQALFMELHSGRSVMGQFYREQITYFLTGISFFIN